MQKSSMYVGITVTKENDDKVELAYHAHGPDYHNLEQQDVLMMESVLQQFSEQYDALARGVESALLAAGFEKAGLNTNTPPGKPDR